MGPLFGDAGVIGNPGQHRTVSLQSRQGVVSDSGQNGLIPPGGLGDQVMQGLMLAGDVGRLQAGRHRFDAFALQRQQQSHAIGTKGIGTIGMAQDRT
jgi:hypothetical protein